jgi:alkane 1-monooxygenase
MKDLKYLGAYSVPLATALSLSQDGWGLYCTVIYVFVIVPIADWMFGKGERNFNTKEAQAKEPMRVFDYMLYFNIPLVFALLGWALWNFTNIEYDAFEKAGLVLSMGVLLATNAINVAHELGHRKGLFERTLSKLLYMPCLYMHFYIEHNFGHHLNVATDKDGASARYNQNLYFFWIRSVTKQYADAWKKQKELLKKSNTRFFSFKNDMLWYAIIQPIYLIAIYYTFSYKTMLFATAIGVVSFLFLETINYIEHYGLRRRNKDLNDASPLIFFNLLLVCNIYFLFLIPLIVKYLLFKSSLYSKNKSILLSIVFFIFSGHSTNVTISSLFSNKPMFFISL